MENIEHEAFRAKQDVLHAQETLLHLKQESQKEHVKHSEEIIQLNQELLSVKKKIEELSNHLHEQNILLNKPLKDILQEYEVLRESNEEQKAIIAMWMLSQRAMKCVAIELAREQGLKETDISNKAMICANSILKDSNNFNGVILQPNIELFQKHKDFLLEKFKTTS